jgi:hypothetical protein
MVDLFLVNSIMLWHLRLSIGLKAITIAASFVEYGFYSIYLLIIEEKVLNLSPPYIKVYILITPPILTTPFYTKQLIVI